MSLDVYLIGEEKTVECVCNDCGHKHSKTEREILYNANITSNLGVMARKAGIYEALWKPEEIGAIKARDIIGMLELGLYLMKKEPELFRKFNSPNGWGIYDDFVPWVESYLKACEENPDAIIDVSY